MLNQKLQEMRISFCYHWPTLQLYLNGSWLEIRSILLFSQVLIIVTVLVAGWENIRLRGLIANMAKLKKRKIVFFYLILSWFQVCK
jgi:hypothetical protein